MNLPTILVTALLLVAVLFAIRHCRNNPGSCCGSCSGCPSSGHCHNQEKDK